MSRAPCRQQTQSTVSRPQREPRLGGLIAAASGLGYPLTHGAIARLGHPGAIAVEAVTVGPLLRDAALVATGTACRLERGPAVLRPAPLPGLDAPR
jgi:hypothetical protein